MLSRCKQYLRGIWVSSINDSNEITSWDTNYFVIRMICIWCFNIFPTECLKYCYPLCLGKASFLFYQGELAQCTGFINTFIWEAAHQGLWDRMLPECQQPLNNACPCRDSFSMLRREVSESHTSLHLAPLMFFSSATFICITYVSTLANTLSTS